MHLPRALTRAWRGMVRRRRPKQILEELLQASQTEYVSPVHLAIICVGLGDNAAALRWLEKAHDQRNATLSAILIEPDVQSLHGDPRFKELSRSIGLVVQ